MFRKQPWSVYFKWLGTEGHDREVVYVQGQYESKIHTLLAAGDVLLMPAGKRMSLAPDSPPREIQEVHATPINRGRHRLQEYPNAQSPPCKLPTSRGDKTHGTLDRSRRQEACGLQRNQLRQIEHTIPPNVEEAMPRGGKRLYGFDTTSHLPVLLVCVDDKGQEVEYYRYDKIMAVKLDDADFNPDNMGASTKMAKQP